MKNSQLLVVCQPCRAPRSMAGATCPPPPVLILPALKTNPDHSWKGCKKFHPEARGLGKGSELSLKLVCFPQVSFILKTGIVFCPPVQGLALCYPSSSETRTLPHACSVTYTTPATSHTTHPQPLLRREEGGVLFQMTFFFLVAGTLPELPRLSAGSAVLGPNFRIPASACPVRLPACPFSEVCPLGAYLNLLCGSSFKS